MKETVLKEVIKYFKTELKKLNDKIDIDNTFRQDGSVLTYDTMLNKLVYRLPEDVIDTSAYEEELEEKYKEIEEKLAEINLQISNLKAIGAKGLDVKITGMTDYEVLEMISEQISPVEDIAEDLKEGYKKDIEDIKKSTEILQNSLNNKINEVRDNLNNIYTEDIFKNSSEIEDIKSLLSTLEVKINIPQKEVDLSGYAKKYHEHDEYIDKKELEKVKREFENSLASSNQFSKKEVLKIKQLTQNELSLHGHRHRVGDIIGLAEYVNTNVDLQEAYDNGDGSIVTTSGKPIVISGLSGVHIDLPSSATTALGLGDALLNNVYYTKVGLDSNLAITASGSQNYTGVVSYVYLNSASTSTGFLAGADLGAVNNMTVGQTATGLYGMNMGMYNYGNGTLTNAYGGYFATYNYQGASGVTTNAYGGYFFIEASGGTTTNQYGIYVGAVTGATNNYAMFTARGLHEFNDQVYIDGRQNITQLIVDANSTQTANVFALRSSSSVDQITFSGTGGAVFNEAGNAVDFRVESDTNANMLFIKGSTNQVGIGRNPSLAIALEVQNTAGSGVLYLQGLDNAYAYIRTGGAGFSTAFRLQNSGATTLMEFGMNSGTSLSYINSVAGALSFLSNNTTAVYIDTSQRVGVGTSSPLSRLDVVGSQGSSITTVSTDTTLDTTHYTVLVDASGGNVTITLPAVASNTRRIYIIKKIDSSSNTVTIDGNASETIDGTTTQVISSQYDYLKIQTDGSAWYIID